MKYLPVFILLLIFISSCGNDSVKDNVSSNDNSNVKHSYRDTITKTNDVNSLDQRINPYVQMAKKTYPESKKRFQNGLPEKNHFLVTIRLYEDDKFEQVFILVKEIKNNVITGRITNNLVNLTNYKRGDWVKVNEKDIYDWTIIKANGKEEGNYVGKFLDAYSVGRVGVILQITIRADGTVRKSKFISAITHQEQDVSYILSPEVKKEAENKALKLKFKQSKEEHVKYTFFFYNIRNEIFEN